MEKHSSNNPISGLYLSRDGYWHIAKTINGRRIRKSTGTKSYPKAVKKFYALMHSPHADSNDPYKKLPDATESKWSEDVSRITKTSWLGKMYRGAINGARLRGIPWDLSFDELIAVAIASDGVCAISGIPFSFEKDNDEWHRAPFSPSLDRINSNDSYHIANCRLVSNIANTALNEWGDEVLLKFVQGVVRRHANRFQI